MDPLETSIPWIAAMGILGLLGVTLFERLIPIMPSTRSWSRWVSLWLKDSGR